MLLSSIILTLAIVSVLLALWQWAAGCRFPLHQTRRPAPGVYPSISILKPLKGCDGETEGCLESWFLQNYPGDRQLLFGVASGDDPVCEIVRKLQGKYPDSPAELVICRPLLGSNAKVSTLCHLARRAAHEILVVSDADVWVNPGFLENLIAQFEPEQTGLVSCFYFIKEPQNLWMKLEAVAVNSDFWTQVLQGISLKKMDFALGAVMAVRRKTLKAIGGFESLLEYLADDYQLGHKVASTGAKLDLCREVVQCRSASQSAREVWNHQLRWARTIRVCQPLPYFFSIISNPIFWPLLAVLLRVPWAEAVLLSALIIRITTAGANYRRITGENAWWAGVLSPLKDLLAVPIWALAFAGNTITWRGQRFTVSGGGKLTPRA